MYIMFLPPADELDHSTIQKEVVGDALLVCSSEQSFLPVVVKMVHRNQASRVFRRGIRRISYKHLKKQQQQEEEEEGEGG